MSLFSSIGKALRRVAGVALPAIGNAALPGLGGVIGGAFGSSLAASAVKRPTGFMAPAALPGAGVLVRTGARDIIQGGIGAATAASQLIDLGVPGPGIFSSSLPRGARPMVDGMCPAGYHPNKQDGLGGPAGTYCVRNRRMNPLNPRAANRSIRRIKGARKTLQKIERQLPKQRTQRRVRHVPSGYRHTE